MEKSSKEFKVALMTFFFFILFALTTWTCYFYLQITASPYLFKLFILGVGIFFALILASFVGGLEAKKAVLKDENKRKDEQLRRLEEELDFKEAQLAALCKSCKDLSEVSKLEHLFEMTMDSVQEVLLADEGSLMLLDGDHKLRIVACRGLGDDVASQVHVKMGERVAGLAVKEQREFLIKGNISNYPLFRNLEPNPLISSSIICPLCCKNEVYGVLNINRTTNKELFENRDLRKASVLAQQVAQSIYHARMWKLLEERADELTKVYEQLKATKIKAVGSPNFFPYLKSPKLPKAS